MACPEPRLVRIVHQLQVFLEAIRVERRRTRFGEGDARRGGEGDLRIGEGDARRGGDGDARRGGDTCFIGGEWLKFRTM